MEEFGRIDILFLNAGISVVMGFEEIEDVKVYEKLMQVNFYANLHITRKALPHLKKTEGQIVVMSSFSGLFGLQMRSAYCASKFALQGCFESLRMELGQQKSNVAVTLICPISIPTDFRKNSEKLTT